MMNMSMSMRQQPPSSIVMEISIVSAEGLNKYSSYFNPTIKPFITISKLPPTPTPTPTHVDVGDGTSLCDHKFRVPVDPTFFSDGYSCLHLQLFTKRRMVGPAQLGWCLIPASDIGLIPPGSIRYLSYRLRARDGSRGHAIINISVKLEAHQYHAIANVWGTPTLDACRTVIGIPVTAIRGPGNNGADYIVPCQDQTPTRRR